MAEAASDPWKEVLSEAIDASTLPVIGTHFRAAVAVAVSKRGLQFPPVNEPDLKFIQLLQRYPDTISILRRPGQDFLVGRPGQEFLVAPSGATEGSTETSKSRPYGIRRDLFQAFSVVSQSKPYYDKSRDMVSWIGSAQPVPTGYVSIPPTSIESQLQLRREFTDRAAPTPAARTQIQTALAGPLPLKAFSDEVRNLGLQREWHGFRTERMVTQLQQWAKDEGVEWNDSWLTESPSANAPRRPAMPTRDSLGHVDALQALLNGLDDNDVQRISVPLDLVLKAIAAARSGR